MFTEMESSQGSTQSEKLAQNLHVPRLAGHCLTPRNGQVPVEVQYEQLLKVFDRAVSSTSEAEATIQQPLNRGQAHKLEDYLFELRQVIGNVRKLVPSGSQSRDGFRMLDVLESDTASSFRTILHDLGKSLESVLVTSSESES